MIMQGRFSNMGNSEALVFTFFFFSPQNKLLEIQIGISLFKIENGYHLVVFKEIFLGYIT